MRNRRQFTVLDNIKLSTNNQLHNIESSYKLLSVIRLTLYLPSSLRYIHINFFGYIFFYLIVS